MGPRLPPELLLQVIEASVNDAWQLRTYTLVDSFFKDAAHRLLYESLTLADCFERTIKVLDYYSRRGLVQHVRMLTLTESGMIKKEFQNKGQFDPDALQDEDFTEQGVAYMNALASLYGRVGKQLVEVNIEEAGSFYQSHIRALFLECVMAALGSVDMTSLKRISLEWTGLECFSLFHRAPSSLKFNNITEATKTSRITMRNNLARATELRLRYIFQETSLWAGRNEPAEVLGFIASTFAVERLHLNLFIGGMDSIPLSLATLQCPSIRALTIEGTHVSVSGLCSAFTPHPGIRELRLSGLTIGGPDGALDDTWHHLFEFCRISMSISKLHMYHLRYPITICHAFSRNRPRTLWSTNKLDLDAAEALTAHIISRGGSVSEFIEIDKEGDLQYWGPDVAVGSGGLKGLCLHVEQDFYGTPDSMCPKRRMF